MSEPVSNTGQEHSSLNQQSVPPPSEASPLPMLETAEPQAEPQAHGVPSELFYTQEDGDKFDFSHPLVDDRDAPFVLPFQLSSEIEPVSSAHTKTRHAQTANALNTPNTPETVASSIKTRLTLRVVRTLLIASVVLVTIVGASLLVFAQSSQSKPPLPTTAPTQATQGTQGTRGTQNIQATQKPKAHTPSARPSPTSTAKTPAIPGPTQTNTSPPAQSPGADGNGNSTTTLPSSTRLAQIGWNQAGFSLGDAVEAQRTALTFTDREMSYDYRDTGTRAHHGGTFTAAVFLLTPGGQVRFNQNDVRVINNALYDQVNTDQIIQQAVNMQASFDQIGTVQQQGQVHQLAWITVSFELFQAQTTSGQRHEGLELDAKGQPVQHLMHVLLLRVAPQGQGANAPMGGTGWLVNTYARDTAHLPLVETVPSL